MAENHTGSQVPQWPLSGETDTTREELGSDGLSPGGGRHEQNKQRCPRRPTEPPSPDLMSVPDAPL